MKKCLGKPIGHRCIALDDGRRCYAYVDREGTRCPRHRAHSSGSRCTHVSRTGFRCGNLTECGVSCAMHAAVVQEAHP